MEVLVDLGEAEFLAEGLDVLERVHAGAQDEEDGGGWAWKLKALFNSQPFRIPGEPGRVFVMKV